MIGACPLPKPRGPAIRCTPRSFLVLWCTTCCWLSGFRILALSTNPIRMRIRLSAQAIAAFCATIGIVTDVRAQGCVETFITDVDGNLYPVVTIGNQCWMGKDLITTRYNDGSDIPDGNVDIDTWNLMGTAAACDYQYGSQPDNLYGRLYNWYAATQPNICPLGWHVPTDAEWTDLAVYLGGPLVTGGKLKETGTLEGGNGLWYAPNTAATNESSFAARPTGARPLTSSWPVDTRSAGQWRA